MTKLILTLILLFNVHLVTSQIIPLNDIARELFQSKKQDYPYRFVVLGDPDPMTDYNSTTGMDNVYFNEMLEEIAAVPEDVSFMVICGDLVWRGYEDEYLNYYNKVKKWMETTSIPVFSIPGNHDFYGQSDIRCGSEPNCAFNNYSQFIDTIMDYYIDFGNDRFILFNNASKESTDAFPNNYEINPLQLNKIENWLRSTNGTKFTFMHVPFTRGSWQSGGLDGYDEFNEYVGPEPGYQEMHNLFVKYDVSIAFAGHIHKYFHDQRDNINYIITGGGQPWLGREYFYAPDSLRANHWLLIEVNQYRPKIIVKMNILGVDRDKEEIINNLNINTHLFSSDFDFVIENMNTSLNKNIFQIFPNPTQKSFNIELNQIPENLTIPIQIYNSTGQLIFNDLNLYSMPKNQLQLNRPGLYFVNLQLDGICYRQKLLVN